MKRITLIAVVFLSTQITFSEASANSVKIVGPSVIEKGFIVTVNVDPNTKLSAEITTSEQNVQTVSNNQYAIYCKQTSQGDGPASDPPCNALVSLSNGNTYPITGTFTSGLTIWKMMEIYPPGTSPQCTDIVLAQAGVDSNGDPQYQLNINANYECIESQ